MYILAIETSGQAGSVALWNDAGLVSLVELDSERRSAQTLAPAMRQILHDAGWRPRDVAVVAVAIGPGSFTGLRVGVTSAKAFAYAVQARVVGVNTLDVIAAQASPSIVARGTRLCAGMDAGRNEVFAAQYIAGETGDWRCAEPAAILSRDAWLHQATPSHVFSGPVLDKLPQPLPWPGVAVPQPLWSPLASTVAKLAVQRAQREQFDDVWSLAPLYLRKSAAEEKADAGRASASAKIERP